jgi:alcohol dehydrogenase class IV
MVNSMSENHAQIIWNAPLVTVSVARASLWNGLPESLTSVTSLAAFKTDLEAFLINNRSDSHTAIR